MSALPADVHVVLDEVHDAAWAATDAVVLELCRARMTMLLGDEAAAARWSPPAVMSPAAAACLAFAEQFVIDVAAMDDATVAAVASELGPDGLMSFANALLVVEQRERVRLLWNRLGLADAS